MVAPPRPLLSLSLCLGLRSQHRRGTSTSFVRRFRVSTVLYEYSVLLVTTVSYMYLTCTINIIHSNRCLLVLLIDSSVVGPFIRCTYSIHTYVRAGQTDSGVTTRTFLTFSLTQSHRQSTELRVEVYIYCTSTRARRRCLHAFLCSDSYILPYL